MIQHIENIRLHYSQLTDKIFQIPDSMWVTPYTSLIDWMLLFSPIEEQTWMALRCFGKVPMYPQYPVGKYFTDFGNPKLKIAIECDGKEWHKDKEKDAERDIFFMNEGWKVFRISGAGCYKMCEDYYDIGEMGESEAHQTLLEYYQTIEGLIKSIGILFFGFKDYFLFEREIDIVWQCATTHCAPAQKEKMREILSERINLVTNTYYEWKWIKSHSNF